MEAHRIKAEELLTTTQKLLPKGAFLGPLLDDHYSVISYNWLKHEFIPFYRDAVGTLKLFASREAEGSDCDDFSMFLRHMISMAGFVGPVRRAGGGADDRVPGERFFRRGRHP